eukprot:m.500862 g.500862  ORF g.500862 m.500862 type:complete len:93 (+) comp21836_c1_seq16:25-303(+)
MQRNKQCGSGYDAQRIGLTEGAGDCCVLQCDRLDTVGSVAELGCALQMQQRYRHTAFQHGEFVGTEHMPTATGTFFTLAFAKRSHQMCVCGE